MRGRLLGVDRGTGEGQVAGDDGRRYRFRPADWAARTEPAIGQQVDFEAEEDRAVGLFPLPGAALPTGAYAPQRGAPRRDARKRDKLVAALLAFLFGAAGVHRFYAGRTWSGAAMLMLSLSVVGLLVSVPWALVDGARLLWMTNREFEDGYAG